MVQIPREVSGFTALPISFLASSAYPTTTKHYIYLKPHDPNVAELDAPRSLFLVNIPITTTELHLRHLFGTQLATGRVERIHFSDSSAKSDTTIPQIKGSKKRKRVTTEELTVELETYRLPEVWQRGIHPSGAYAVVVFVDRPSMEASIKAAKKAVKLGTGIIWGKGIEEKLPSLGLQRYSNHNRLKYPSRKELLLSVDSYMTAFSRMEETRSREAAKKRQVPDEDGFVTVTRGARGGVVRKEDAKELGEKLKEKDKGLEDFYRFQMRERRKEQQGDLMRKFEEDKKKVEEMRKRRGRLRVIPQ